MARRSTDFQTIRSEGGLLPADLLRRVLDPKDGLDGARPEDYGLPEGERLNEVITQAWNRLRKHWAGFRTGAEAMPAGEAGTGLTNDKWNLPLMRELGFGLLPATTAPEIGGQTYAISRFFGPVPIHLIGCGLSLDRRAAGVRGAAAMNPHGLVQEFLNRSPKHLWAIITNGQLLRILRDSQALSRQSYLEFDLSAMFEGEVYSDFVLLWLVAHATRFIPREADRPETCRLEQWTKIAEEQGTRALGDLRMGVERALQVLGEGLTSHPRNTDLRDALRNGDLSLSDFHGELLRVIYRLIFLFVAEDRTLDGLPMLHPPDESESAALARERYAAHYSTGRLRDLASQIKGSRHGDLWRQFQLVVSALSGNKSSAPVRQHLALPVLGGFLWDPASTGAINDAELTNHDLLEVVRNLAFIRRGKVLRPVDYRNLGAEELGGVYESLLALTPQVSADGARFTFTEFAGSKRKTTGSYYTPDSLVQCLLDSALDPVVEEAIKGKSGENAEKAILDLKVCDPAVGSGHFLVGAARRLARHLARVRALAQGESEPSPLLYQQVLREVIGHCIYGVDINPMAAELCRVSLWLEALEPGKPLSFLEHHIRVGNSLLGSTPELIEAGLPDAAFTPIEGDDKKVCSGLKKRNKLEREGQQDMVHMMVAESHVEYASIEGGMRDIDKAPDTTVDEIELKADRFHRLVVSPEYRHAQMVADTWCAAFVWKRQAKSPIAPITTETMRLLKGEASALTRAQQTEVQRLSRQYQFFHWHLAFPEVFAYGGFDCILGNPPWERVKLQEKEWFAERSPDIANAPNAAARKRLIEELKSSDPELHALFKEDLRKAEGESHLLRNSGRYPLCGRGDINLYTVFAELMRSLLNERGRTGCVLPTGIATDDTTKYFFQDVIETNSLASLFDFENRLGLFPAVDSRMKFCLFTTGRGSLPTAEIAEFVFFAHSIDDLNDPNRRFTLSSDEIAMLNPNTHTCPIFRFGCDAEITKAIYRRVPVLIYEAHDDKPEENHWRLKTRRIFDMNKPETLLLCQLEPPSRSDTNEWLLMMEAKLMNQFDHRFASYADGVATTLVSAHKGDPCLSVMPRYWIRRRDVLGGLSRLVPRDWLLVWRDITNATNERTALAAAIPLAGTDFTLRVGFSSVEPILKRVLLIGNWNAFSFDYCARQLMGGTHLADYISKQLPVLPPGIYDKPVGWDRMRDGHSGWLVPRVLELTYTAWDMQAFALDCDYSGPPFRWDEDRRFLLRCELDAAFFHLYLQPDVKGNWQVACREDGCPYDESPEQVAELKSHFPTPRDAANYIMDTFPIVKRKDEEKWDEYRTKRVILGIYDAMLEAVRTGTPYQTRLDPSPGPPETELPEWQPGQPKPADWPSHIHAPKGCSQ